MRERVRELKEDVGENRLALIFSAFFTSVLFIFIFARQHLYPFGDYTLLYVDGDQYASWMNRINDVLTGGESFFYSFRTVLGSGAIATEGYYAMSPFNLLLLLFPDNPVAGIHFTACIKHIAAALTFCVLLNATHEGMAAEKSVFSTAYAFIGYMSFFAWNLSWMDGVVVLPLVALGILRLVKENRHGLYVISLACAVISNFYIGYMICIASVMIYVVTVFGIAEGRSRVGLLRYLLSSFAGAGLSAFVLVPSIMALPDDRKEGLAELFHSMHPTLKPADLFSMLFTGRICPQSANLPVIFSGILPLLLVVIFFFREDVPRKKKGAVFAVFAFLAFSFWNSMPNRIWHGMSENVWYNYRYSFVFSFFLLLVAFDCLSSLSRAWVPFKRMAICLCIFLVWMYNDTQSGFYAEDITRDVILVVAGMLLCRRLCATGSVGAGSAEGDGFLKRTYRRIHNAFHGSSVLPLGLMFILMACNIYRNAVTVMWPEVRVSDSAAMYLEETGRARQAIAAIEDDGFYRLEKNYRIGRADAPLLRYHGVSNYASTENVPLLEMLRSYGIAHGWKWGYHTEHVPFATDTLLGMKYLLQKTGTGPEHYTAYGKTGEISVFENQSAMPLVMYARELPPETADKKNPFLGLNAVYDAFAGDGARTKEVFRAVESTAHAENQLYYRIFTVTEETAGLPVYLYLDFPVQRVYVYEDERATSFPYNPEQYVYRLGPFAAGTRVQVCLYVPQPVMLVEAEEDGDRSDTQTMQTTAEKDSGSRDRVIKDAADREEEEVSGVFVGAAGGRRALRSDVTTQPGVQSGTQILPAPDEGYVYRHFRPEEVLLYTEDAAVVAETAEKVQAHTKALTVSGARVSATVTADDAGGYAVTTIPYDEAWRITVDGVRVNPVRYMEQFLAVPLEAGEHVIEMHYLPKGFVAGVLLTVLSAIVLVLWKAEAARRKTGQKEPSPSPLS